MLSNSQILMENSFSIFSEEELVQAFRSGDQKKLQLPDDFQYPMSVRSYLSWKEPSGTYVYLVFKLPNWDQPRGVAMKRSAASAEGVGSMCSWCNSYGTSEEIALLSIRMSETESFSYILCQDLSCISKIEDAAARSGREPDKWIEDLYFKMEKFFERVRSYPPVG